MGLNRRSLFSRDQFSDQVAPGLSLIRRIEERGLRFALRSQPSKEIRIRLRSQKQPGQFACVAYIEISGIIFAEQSDIACNVRSDDGRARDNRFRDDVCPAFQAG